MGTENDTDNAIKLIVGALLEIQSCENSNGTALFWLTPCLKWSWLKKWILSILDKACGVIYEDDLTELITIFLLANRVVEENATLGHQDHLF